MSLTARLLRLLVWIYRLAVRPWLPPSCRFHPSCSEYALDALRRHGAARGCTLIARRISRCHPWGGCGYDPVPDPPVDRSHCKSGQTSI